MRQIDVNAIVKGSYNISLCEGQAIAVLRTLSTITATIDVLSKELTEQTGISSHFVFGNDAVDECRRKLFEHTKDNILRNITAAETFLNNSTLPERFNRKLQRAKNAVTSGSSDQAALFRELSHDLMEELAQPLFLYINHEHRRLYEDTVNRPGFSGDCFS